MFRKMDGSEKGEEREKNVGATIDRRAGRWFEGLDRALERKPAYELADNR